MCAVVGHPPAAATLVPLRSEGVLAAKTARPWQNGNATTRQRGSVVTDTTRANANTTCANVPPPPVPMRWPKPFGAARGGGKWWKERCPSTGSPAPPPAPPIWLCVLCALHWNMNYFH